MTERIIDDQIEVNVQAAEKMAKLHDALESLGYEGHELEVYLVRLLFCLFAEDTGIFPQDSLLHYPTFDSLGHIVLVFPRSVPKNLHYIWLKLIF